MKRCKPFLVVLAVITLWTSAGHAAEAGHIFELSPMIGGHLFEGNQDLDYGYTLGLIAGFPVSDRVTLEVGGAYIKTESDPGNVDVDGQRFGFDGLFHFMPNRDFRPFVLLGAGLFRLDPDTGPSSTDLMANYGAGLKYELMDRLDLRAELRHVMPFDEFYNNLVWQLGLTWRFGDRMMAKEKKPMEKMMAMDSDGDGVPDDRDRCVDTPAGMSVDASGCPVMMDGDKDGVADDMDLCPGTAAEMMVDANGCPMDSDSDGVPDSIDVCPGTPVGQNVDELGCPVPLDADADGVEDDADRCPGTPVGATVDSRGCWVMEGLFFSSGKSMVMTQYEPILNDVVKILKANMGLKIAIEGYTDSQGRAAGNQRLSEARARAVHDYVMGMGIEKSRLKYMGYGEQSPVADNATAEGRMKNRRVELRPMM